MDMSDQTRSPEIKWVVPLASEFGCWSRIHHSEAKALGNRPASMLEPRKSAMRLFRIVLMLFVLLAIALVWSSPWWHDKHFGVAGDESAAVSVLRNVNAPEQRHATTHADKGSTCTMTQLRDSQRSSDAGDSSAGLVTGQSRGYKFALVSCAAEINGIVAHYQVTAVPARPYRTGVRALCTDESGRMFYDNESSALQCLALRHELPDGRATRSAASILR